MRSMVQKLKNQKSRELKVKVKNQKSREVIKSTVEEVYGSKTQSFKKHKSVARSVTHSLNHLHEYARAPHRSLKGVPFALKNEF